MTGLSIKYASSIEDGGVFPSIAGAVSPNDLTPSTFKVLVSTVDNENQPVLFFPYPAVVELERPCPAGYEVHEIEMRGSQVRISYSFTKRYMYNALRQVFKAANVKKSIGGNPTAVASMHNWNIFWGHHLTTDEFSALLPHQRVNHFPESFELGRKDRLCGHLLRMKKRFRDSFSNVIPETYLTANEYDKQQFVQRYAAEPRVLWILKPPNLSCGRGIKIISAATTPNPKLTRKKAYIAQRYISNPFLINDLKFDLRLYVLVTSYDPLRVYIYDDGLVRFCTEKYSITSGEVNPFAHLTNYSINKKNAAAFQPNQDGDREAREDNDNGDRECETPTEDSSASASSKWSVKYFFKYLREHGISASKLETFLRSVDDLVVKTLLAVEHKMVMAGAASQSTSSNSKRKPGGGFELYGFDVLVEGESLQPWLLEVNVFPSLSSSSPLDKRIKTMLMCDVFQLIGVPFMDASAVQQQIEKEKKERLLGVSTAMPPHHRHEQATATDAAPISSKGKPTPRTRIKPTPVRHSAGQRHKSKAVSELLAKTGVMLELDDADLRTITEMEAEEHRCGHFRRLFPTATSWTSYGALLETPRYRTVLCMRWLHLRAQDPRRLRVMSPPASKPSQ